MLRRRHKKPDALQGTLDLLVLRTLRRGPHHGYGIAADIQSISDDILRVEEGSLYPALHRLENKGAIGAAWGVSDKNRQAKFYSLTPLGRRTLRAESESWTRFADAIAKVLAATQPA